jgi:formate-dependent nitrite reductase cytochrome c552 subunit
VATKYCVSCHMPKLEVPEMHHEFTDHKIRIVKPGDQYTD